ncbi:MAG: iron-sulfur cluster assembly accessory protein [Nitrospiria bacterium]
MKMITITDLAKEKVVAAMEAEHRQGNALRVSVMGGGTPRVQYGLAFESLETRASNDVLLDAGPFKVLVDNQSALFLKGAIVDFIQDLQGGGFKITNPDAPKMPEPKLDHPLAKEVQKLIDEKINPGVAGHGGVITLVDVKDDSVYVRLGGGCHGCASSTATLKQGIETMIKAEIPAIKNVIDVTDHAVGASNPYYR